MKVGYLVHSLANGGVQNLLLRQLEPMKECVDEQFVFVVTDSLTLQNEFESRGATVVPLRGATLDNPRSLVRALFEIRKYDLDLLHTHVPISNIIGRISSLLSDTNVVSTYHNVSENPGFSGVSGALDLLTRRLSERNIAVSKSVCHDQRSFFGKDNWKTIPNAIDVEEFAEEVEKCSPTKTPTTGPTILNVGRYHPQKRQSLFIDTLEELRKTYPELDIGGIIVGHGELKDDLKNRAIEKNISDSVEVTGEVESVAPYYHSADVLLMTSKYEGQSIVSLEAFCAGIPVVSTDVPGICDVVDDSVGKLVKSNPEDLAAAVIEVLNSGVDYEIITKRYAQENFGIDRYVSDYCSVYTKYGNNG